MELENTKKQILPAIKNILIFFILLSIVLFVNFPVISFDMMYPEQPSIYVINQTITRFSDLLNFYLHPKLLHTNIPFFRPSGHYLIYQLLTPFLGWHNTKAFFIVSFIFLTFIGYFLIRLYQLLFPTFKSGGYVAFSIYLMHPALSISRFTLMHFEFAYVCFLTISLYLFALFVQKYMQNQRSKSVSWKLFISSLALYILAVTFKEPAVMLGPVLMCYFWIFQYDQRPLLKFVQNMLSSRQNWWIMVSITLVSLLLGLYLLASWPNIGYASKIANIMHTFGTLNAFLKDAFGVTRDYITVGFINAPDLAWRTIVFPPSAQLDIWGMLWLSLFATVMIFFGKAANTLIYKKSLTFLYVSSALFMILPFCWGTGGPWHYSLTILCLSLVMGFSIEYLCRRVIKDNRWIYGISVIIFSLNLLIGIQVNNVNIKKYSYLENGALGLAVNRNAVMNPPDIKNQINAESVIVVEDSRLHNDYILGNAAYPFMLVLGDNDYAPLRIIQSQFVIQFDPVYSGNLFRYAYLMPSLKEELYPFKVEQMGEVFNEVIYNWLKHYNNIFCLGYDSRGNWLDKTKVFKQNLLEQKAERNLRVNQYSSVPIDHKNANLTYTKELAYPDDQLCQFTCDQDDQCKGFVYENASRKKNVKYVCYFTTASYSATRETCTDCQWFAKQQG